MAKKTTTVTTEEEVTPEVNPKAEEHDKKVLEALETKDEGALEIKTEDLNEETPKEEKKEEEKSEEKVESAPQPPLDKETIKKELKEEVTQDVKEEIVSQLQGTKDEKEDAYARLEKEIWEKENRAPTYKEALDLIKTQAKEEIKTELNAEIEEEEKKAEETKKAEEAQQQELTESLNKDWDEQLEDLVKSGKIPAVKDPDNNEVTIIRNAEGKEIERIPVDEGKKARYELFKAMYSASEERIANNQKPLTNLKEIFYEHYNKDKQPAGANAPVSGVRKSVSQDSGTTFKYSDIHNAPMEDLLRQAQ